ncbi:MAG: SCO family protein [Weeksellaceae bacterium]
MKKAFLLLTAIFTMLSCKHEEKPKEVDLSNSIFQLDSTWEDQNGQKIKLAELNGKILVIAMIYTECKTACPMLTNEMRNIERSIGNYDPAQVRLVLVSIDPKTDTPEKMKAYLKLNNFEGEQWLFLRSDDESTREFANVLSVKYKKISPMDFSHSNIITVFSKYGELAYQKAGLSNDIKDVAEEVKEQIKKS